MAEIRFPAAVYKVQTLVACDACGKLIYRPPSVQKRAKHAYCSSACRSKHLRRLPNTKCPVCGTGFHVKPSRLAKERVMCCSVKCRGIYQRAQTSFVCKACGKEFTLRPSEIREGKGTFCSRGCQLSQYSSEGNPNWKHGMSGKTEYYRSIRKGLVADLTESQWQDTLMDFEHRCAYCGRAEREVGTLHKEHIIPASRGGGLTKTNIVPACGRCNSTKHNRTPKEAGMTMIKLPDYINDQR